MKDLDVIEAQLSRVMAFFPRTDTKVAGLFTVNSAILTICALNVEAGDFEHWYITVPGVFVLLGLIASYAFLYRCNFPELKGGQGSLIYFSAISERTEIQYKSEFEGVSDAKYRADLLGQIWQNSGILAQKYKAIAISIRLTLITLIPFAMFLVMTAIEHSRVPVVSGS